VQKKTNTAQQNYKVEKNSNHQKWFEITHLGIISHTINIYNHVHIGTSPTITYPSLLKITRI
jgi:hypothetical protein